jgi:hypothetical protein
MNPLQPRCPNNCCNCCPNSGCTKQKTSDEDAWLSVYFDLISIRVGTYDIRGSDADKRTVGFLFSLDPDIIATSDYLTYRSSLYAAIGGGTDGLEGQLDYYWRIGARGYFGSDHGPFARIGLGFQLLGNNKLYRSHFELPELELGYQLMNDDLTFEIGARGGLILGGRYFTGDDAERRIDTEPEAGGFVTLHADDFRLNVGAMRIWARQTAPGTPIDEATAELCVTPFGMLLLCADGAFHRGDVRLPNGSFSTSTATYFGGTIGIGVVRNGGPAHVFD